MLLDTRAIVLRRTLYGEREAVVDLVTEARGRLQVMVRLRSGRGRGGVSGGVVGRELLGALTPWEAVVDWRAGRGLQRVREVRHACPQTTVATDVVKSAAAMFVAEVTSQLVAGEECDAGLFGFLWEGVAALDAAGPSAAANFHLAFIVGLTRRVGFLPSGEDWREGSVFDMRTGEFTLSLPGHSDWLGAAEARQLRQVLRLTFRSMHLLRMSGAERSRVLGLVVRYLSLHQEGFREPRSLSVLREVF